ncbi:hypothetical protein HBZC1_01240 [Helicobacter bizzozeronii CIII-1]|uniref:Uncharacterized protein n=1 Tax=Helicobacter bizzozeronii (strain CIII-1) TaxID=1002804 RepID=F8KQV6_HELBC|nr:hypothetical protein HBZC1_01240 [Helicobacter bizzozeronii CIII-1]
MVDARTPKWVGHCDDGAQVHRDRVVACGAGDILDGDVDYAVNIASTRAKDKLADFSLKSQQPALSGKFHVEIRNTKLDARWVGQGQVYVLLSMDLEENKQAKITQEPEPAGDLDKQDKQGNLAPKGVEVSETPKNAEKIEQKDQPKQQKHAGEEKDDTGLKKGLE